MEAAGSNPASPTQSKEAPVRFLFVAKAKRISPIFPVRDIGASLDHCRRLGFTAREYGGGGCGFVTLDRIELHLGVVPDDAPLTPMPWLRCGYGAEATSALHRTPSGNIIRFGSPLSE